MSHKHQRDHHGTTQESKDGNESKENKERQTHKRRKTKPTVGEDRTLSTTMDTTMDKEQVLSSVSASVTNTDSQLDTNASLSIQPNGRRSENISNHGHYGHSDLDRETKHTHDSIASLSERSVHDVSDVGDLLSKDTSSGSQIQRSPTSARDRPSNPILMSGGLGSISLDPVPPAVLDQEIKRIHGLNRPFHSRQQQQQRQEIKGPSNRNKPARQSQAETMTLPLPLPPLALTMDSHDVLHMEDLIEYGQKVIDYCMEMLNGKYSALGTSDWCDAQAELIARWNAFHFTRVFYKYHGSGSSRTYFDCSIPAFLLYARIVLLATGQILQKNYTWIGTEVDKKQAEQTLDKQMKQWHTWWAHGPSTSADGNVKGIMDIWEKERHKMDQSLSQIVLQRKSNTLTLHEFEYLETCARYMYWVDLQLHILKTRQMKRANVDDSVYKRFQQAIEEYTSFEPAADFYTNLCNTIYEYHLPAACRWKYLQAIESLGGRPGSDRSSSLASVMDKAMDDDLRKQIHSAINVVDGDMMKIFHSKEHPFHELSVIRVWGDFLKEQYNVEFFQHYFLGPYQFPLKNEWLNQVYREEIGMQHKRCPIVVSLLGQWYVECETKYLYACKNAQELMVTWFYCLLEYCQGELEDGFKGCLKISSFIIDGKES